MSSSDPWSCGSRRRRDERGVDRRRQEDRPTYPTPCFVGPSGFRVVVLQVARPARKPRQERPAQLDAAVFRSLTRPDEAGPPAPDLLKRDFAARAVNEKWCGELTEIPTAEGKLYLAAVEDLASRRCPARPSRAPRRPPRR